MKGLFFTLDIALALFFLTLIFYSQADVQAQQAVSLDFGTAYLAQDTLLAMEKTGFLAAVAQGDKTSQEVAQFINESLPGNLAANFSLSAYTFQSNDFQPARQVNASTGMFFQPFSTSKRVSFIPRKAGDYYVITELVVGFK